MLSLISAASAVFPPSGAGCVAASCSPRRDGFAGSFALPRAPRLLWSALSATSAECSGDGRVALCIGRGGNFSTSGLNASGPLWAMGVGGREQSPPPYVDPLGNVGGALEGDGAERSVVLRSMELGGIAFSKTIDSTDPGPGALGPWVLPRVGGGDDSLVLVGRPDGLLLAWNVELDLCWASRFLCLQPGRDEQCNRPSTGRLRALGAPSMLPAGGAAYFAASAVAAPAQACPLFRYRPPMSMSKCMCACACGCCACDHVSMYSHR